MSAPSLTPRRLGARPRLGAAAFRRTSTAGAAQVGLAVARRAQTAACAVALAAIALAMSWSHIAHGGFYYDDWWVLSLVTHHGGGAAGAFARLWPWYGQRPGQLAYYALAEPAIGYRAGAQLALAAGLLALECTLLFALLRRLGLAALEAAPICALVVLFPFSDSAWLWPIMSVSTLAIIVSLAGLTLALRALAASGRRAWWLHACSLLLYVAGIVSYELFAVAGCLAGLLYVWRCDGRAARLRWLADVVVIVATMAVCRWLLPGDIATPRSVQSPLGAIHHAGAIVVAGARLAGAALLPFGGQGSWPGFGLICAVALAAAVAARRPSLGAETRRALRRRLALAGAGALLALAAWAVYIPAGSNYTPSSLATANRINALAGIGVAILVYASLALAATLAALLGRRRLRLSPTRGAALAAAVAAAALAGAYGLQTARDAALWDRAAAAQRAQLERLRAAVATPGRRATVYAYDGPAQVGAVPVLNTELDLTGALRLTYPAQAPTGVPVVAGVRFVCAAAGLYPVGNGYGVAQAARYNLAYLFDIGAGRALRVTDRAQCLRATRALRPELPVGG